MKSYMQLAKSGIVFLVLLCGALGYFLGVRPADDFPLIDFCFFVLGLAFLSGGSCALNQVQESELDKLMPRTQGRPIPAGIISRKKALVFSNLMIGLGCSVLVVVEPIAAFLGLLTVILYNGFYTLWWKPRLSFGAVPGAIPGAMPVVIGYAAAQPQFLTAECFYLFMVMFLWQMPHFWALAIRFKDDYASGGVPVLPTQLGVNATVFHIGLYVFVYVALAIGSPWFVEARFFYLAGVVPFCLIVLYEYFRFSNKDVTKSWLRFFLLTNASLIVFLMAPVFDKWIGYLVRTYGA